MKALDTSVLVRYYTMDEPRQAKIATRIIAGEAELFIPRTVLVELYFVLRYAKKYLFDPARIGEVLRHLIDLPNVTVENYDMVVTALASQGLGLEFPDALHVAASVLCDEFLTFDDRRFARRARRAGIRPRVTVPVA